MRASIERQNIEAELAEIDKRLESIVADTGVLEMQRQGLVAIQERLTRCLRGRKAARHTPAAAATETPPPPATTPPGTPTMPAPTVKPKRTRKKRLTETSQPEIVQDRYKCLESTCGKPFMEPGKAGKKGDISICPHCGSPDIDEEIKA